MNDFFNEVLPRLPGVRSLLAGCIGLGSKFVRRTLSDRAGNTVRSGLECPAYGATIMSFYSSGPAGTDRWQRPGGVDGTRHGV